MGTEWDLTAVESSTKLRVIEEDTSEFKYIDVASSNDQSKRSRSLQEVPHYKYRT